MPPAALDRHVRPDLGDQVGDGLFTIDHDQFGRLDPDEPVGHGPPRLAYGQAEQISGCLATATGPDSPDRPTARWAPTPEL